MHGALPWHRQTCLWTGKPWRKHSEENKAYHQSTNDNDYYWSADRNMRRYQVEQEKINRQNVQGIEEFAKNKLY